MLRGGTIILVATLAPGCGNGGLGPSGSSTGSHDHGDATTDVQGAQEAEAEADLDAADGASLTEASDDSGDASPEQGDAPSDALVDAWATACLGMFGGQSPAVPCSVWPYCQLGCTYCKDDICQCNPLQNVADGTSCEGTGMYCVGGSCTTCGASCTPANMCHLGTVDCSGGVRCVDTGQANDAVNGMTCGAYEVCDGGACVSTLGDL